MTATGPVTGHSLVEVSVAETVTAIGAKAAVAGTATRVN